MLTSDEVAEWIRTHGPGAPLVSKGKAATWDDVLAAFSGTDNADIEAAINEAMDRGLVYEPLLGVLVLPGT